MSNSSPSTPTRPPLPPSVEQLIQRICAEQCQTPPDAGIRRQLGQLGEEASLQILKKISAQNIRNLSGYIAHMIKDARGEETGTTLSSPSKRIAISPTLVSSPMFVQVKTTDIEFMAKKARNEETGTILSSPSKRIAISPSPVSSPNGLNPHSPISEPPLVSPSSNSGKASISGYSPQLLALSDLEFRKAFLVLSYTGRGELDKLMAVDDIMRLNDLPMGDFEMKVWDAVKGVMDEKDRIKYLNWDSGKTHLYHCNVILKDGSYTFKGPYLGNTRTHLQRVLGDDNVLIVKFAVDATDSANKMVGSSNYGAVLNRIYEEGILIGLRRYRLFAFKDGGKEEKKRGQTLSSVKGFFVRFESLAPCEEGEPYILANKKISEARSLFMHVNMVSSMAKYMARFSLILSTTIKLQVDLANVTIKRDEDILCRDENGDIVLDEDREPLIHTDGTGFISEDLALKTPKDFTRAKYIKDENFERFLDHVNCEDISPVLRRSEAHTREPPLLMQVRLFYNGLAVKGTLLVNKKLEKNTICIRPSMIKVETDPRLHDVQTFNSLEIVGISNKPRRTFLSKNLIALLSYGGVPKECFLNLVAEALEDSRTAYSDKGVAFRVAVNHGEIDDDFTVARMILAGVPLNEPYLQYRLSELNKEERKALKGGRLPIPESFYLMGTTDPTGSLERGEVCVILDRGQISGDLLVYRNPGLHFGDIHCLTAVYVEALEEIVGNAKYGIFFSTKGERSVASEIANGDFDGDVYWVSRNPELLENFKESEPWRRIYSTPSVPGKKPSELLEDELEHELFQLFKGTMFQRSNPMSVAADSWTAFMDRLLTLGEDCTEEKDCMKVSMHQLVDTYYDALDAPKSGKKVVIPDKLKVELFPHYMGRPNSYHSASVLGLIYDFVEKSLESEELPAGDVEVSKLPCFDVEVPSPLLIFWGQKYDEYRKDMSKAMETNDDGAKKTAANAVIDKYKQLLYDAAEFEESARDEGEIFNEAVALYNVVYNYVEKKRDVGEKKRDVGKCRFVWKVAGQALLKLYVMKHTSKLVYSSSAVLREVFN